MNILFIDFDGIISKRLLWHSLEGTSEKKMIEDVIFENNHFLFDARLRGKHDSKAICEILAQKTGISNEFLLSKLQEDCKNRDISEKIITILKSKKSKYKIILATNNVDAFDKWIVPYNKKYFEVFDYIINSRNHGYLKRDAHGKFFSEALNIFDSSFEKSILIDDNIVNCDIFKQLGGNAFCLHKEQDILTLIKKL